MPSTKRVNAGSCRLPMPANTSLNLGMTKTISNDQDADGHDQHGARDKTCAALTLPLIFCAFSMNSARRFKHDFQHAAQFAGLDHVDEQAVENLGMLGQRLGKGAAAFDGQRQFAENALERGVALLFFQHAQTAQQRQAGVHQRRQLARESRQHLRLHPAAQAGDLDVDVHAAALFLAAGLGRPALAFLPAAFSWALSASTILVGNRPISFTRPMASFWLATSRVPLVSLPRESIAT